MMPCARSDHSRSTRHPPKSSLPTGLRWPSHPDRDRSDQDPCTIPFEAPPCLSAGRSSTCHTVGGITATVGQSDGVTEDGWAQATRMPRRRCVAAALTGRYMRTFCEIATALPRRHWGGPRWTFDKGYPVGSVEMEGLISIVKQDRQGYHNCVMTIRSIERVPV